MRILRPTRFPSGLLGSQCTVTALLDCPGAGTGDTDFFPDFFFFFSSTRMVGTISSAVSGSLSGSGRITSSILGVGGYFGSALTALACLLLPAFPPLPFVLLLPLASSDGWGDLLRDFFFVGCLDPADLLLPPPPAFVAWLDAGRFFVAFFFLPTLVLVPVPVPASVPGLFFDELAALLIADEAAAAALRSGRGIGKAASLRTCFIACGRDEKVSPAGDTQRLLSCDCRFPREYRGTKR